MSGGHGRSRENPQAGIGPWEPMGMTLQFGIRRHARLGSTNDEAQHLAAAGAPAGTVVVAATQTAGRGRQGRVWASPPGNLYASVLLRPEVPMERLGELAFLAGLAVAETVAALLPPERQVRLKWPNDVLVDGAKIAGILIEQAGDAVVLGIGLNIAHPPPEAPYPATALVAAGADAAVETVLPLLLATLGGRLSLWQAQGFAPIRAAWLARAHPVGTPLRVRLGGRAETGMIAGRFAGIDAAGALLLDTAAGPRRIVAGEVAVARDLTRDDAPPWPSEDAQG